MAKSVSHKALDAALAYLADRADTLVLCAGSPASAGEAVTPADEGGRALGLAAMLPGLGNGDFELAPGAGSGRRLVVAECEEVAIVASGRADHLALVAQASGELLVVTTLAEPREVAEGESMAVDGFSHEIADPV